MRDAGNVVFSCFAGVFVAGVLNLATTVAGDGRDHVPGELLVKPKAGVAVETLEKILKGNHASVIREIQQIGVRHIKVPERAIDQVKQSLSHNPYIEFAEFNYIAEEVLIPNDTYYSSEQWHHAKISSPAGWDITTGSNGVSIAIIDSGADPSHPDLAAKLLPGYNYLDNTTNTADVRGHGTAVAGCAAAVSNNAIGVAGVAWNNPVMPVVVVNSSGIAYYSNIAKGITYAADHGARVINISIAGSSMSSTLQNAVNYAWNKGVVVIAAAANKSTSTPYYPAACNNVVAVSATTSSDTLASFSNYGSWIDISAPGTSIKTTIKGGGYGSGNETSFASPIAAGLAALILSVNPALTNADVVAIMTGNADDLGSPGFDISYGYGRINVYKSVVAAKNTLPQPDTSSPTVSISSPLDGATVSNTTVVNVSATDNAGVSGVELFIDGTLYAADATEPFSFSWDTTKYPDGTHSLEAHAYDFSQNMGQSEIVMVSVNNPIDTTSPLVSILYPISNAEVSDTTAVDISATDDMGVSKAELYIDGDLYATNTTEPFSFSWDTTKYPEGAHSLEVRAYDFSQNMDGSSPVVVTVSNPKDMTPPVVTITSPANHAQVTNSQKINVTATDNLSVSTIELYLDSVLTSTVTNQSTLSYTWNTRKIARGAHNITAKAYDAAENINIHTITVYK
ncbi:MAG: peptidase S8 [Candidatus Brocadia sp.]|nr:peptidase S8 [Candidatus Brocadia sp.]